MVHNLRRELQHIISISVSKRYNGTMVQYLLDKNEYYSVFYNEIDIVLAEFFFHTYIQRRCKIERNVNQNIFL